MPRMSEHQRKTIQELLDELQRAKEEAHELLLRTRPTLESELRQDLEQPSTAGRTRDIYRKRSLREET